MNLSGISLNGVPLKEKDVENFGQEDKEIKELKDKHYLYKQPLIKSKNKKGRNSKMNHMWLQVNQSNLSRNIIDSLINKKVRNTVIAVLLARSDYLALKEIHTIILSRASQSDLKLASLKIHISNITKSPLGDCIEIIPKKPNESAKYRLKTDSLNKYSFEEAVKIVDKFVKINSKKPKKNNKAKQIKTSESSENKTISAKLQTPFGDININVTGKIQVEFSFKVE